MNDTPEKADKSSDVKFTDLFNPNEPRSEKELSEYRLSICKTCPFFTGTRCRKCGCYMALKSTLKRAKCPVGHW